MSVLGFDDTNYTMSDHYSHTEDSTLNFFEIPHSQIANSLFNMSNYAELEVRNLHPNDIKLMRKAFKSFTLQYYDLVRESIMETLSLMLSRKHYNQLVYKSFLIAHNKLCENMVRRIRLSEMMSEAEIFGMRELLYQWRLHTLNRTTMRENEVKAKLFHQTLINAKYFKLFQQLLTLRTNKILKLMRVVCLMEKNVVNNVLRPWSSLSKKYKRLQLCKEDINNNYNKYLKCMVLNGMCKVYNRRIGVYVLDVFIVKRSKSNFLHSLTHFYHYSLKLEDKLCKSMRRMRMEKIFDIWRFASLYKLSTQFYHYKLKSKSLHHWRRYGVDKKLLRKKFELLKHEVDTKLLQLYYHKLTHSYTSIKLRKKLLHNLVTTVDITSKKITLQLLYNNYKSKLREEMNKRKCERYCKSVLYRRVMSILSSNAIRRCEKRDKLTLATISYKRYLLSNAFNELVKLYSERLLRYENLLIKFNNLRDLTLKKSLFKVLKQAIQKSQHLNHIQQTLCLSYEKYLKKTIFKRMEHIITTNSNRKNALVSELTNLLLRSSDQSMTGLRLFVTPLKSELLVFTLYLLTLNTRFHYTYDLYYELSDDDLINSLLNTINTDQLTEFRKNNKALLYQLTLSFISTNVTTGMSDIPLPVSELLQQLYMQQLFMQQLSNNSITEILRKLPVWKLINLRFLLLRKPKILKAWRRLTAQMITRRVCDSEFLDNFSQINAMLRKSNVFSHWLQLSTEFKHEKLRIKEELYTRFYDHINSVVTARKSVPYTLLYYNYVISEGTGVELVEKVRNWYWSFLRRNPQASAPILRILWLRRIFTHWHAYVMDDLSIKRVAGEFCRISILFKSFKIWYNATALRNTKHEQMCQNIRHTVDILLKEWVLVGWYRISKLNTVLTAKKYQLTHKLFSQWHNYTSYKSLLNCHHNTINKRTSRGLLMKYYNVWYEAYECRMREYYNSEQSSQYNNLRIKRRHYAYWSGYCRKKVHLLQCQREIRDNYALNLKNYYLTLLGTICKLKQLHNQSVLNRSLTTFKLLLFTKKMGTLVQTTLENSVKEGAKRFLSTLYHTVETQRKLDNTMRNEKMYLLLYKLSNVKFDRTLRGIRILNANAYYNIRYKIVQRRHYRTVLANCYAHWKLITTKHAFWHTKLCLLSHTNHITGVSDDTTGDTEDTEDTGDTEDTDVTVEMCEIRIKYVIRWCRRMIVWWRSECGVLRVDGSSLGEIYVFARTNRVVEALRALQENCLALDLLRVCRVRVRDFVDARDLKLKSKVFKYLKAELLENELSQILTLQDANQ